ncbi:hypothetical protein ACFLZH_00545 [Patescibacteria group bacterium]
MIDQTPDDPFGIDEIEFAELMELLSLLPPESRYGEETLVADAIKAVQERTTLAYKLLGLHREVKAKIIEDQDPDPIEIPENWKRCEIKGLLGKFNKLMVVTEGKVSVHNHGNGHITISPFHDNPPSPKFPDIIREIKKRQPQVEISFEV